MLLNRKWLVCSVYMEKKLVIQLECTVGVTEYLFTHMVSKFSCTTSLFSSSTTRLPLAHSFVCNHLVLHACNNVYHISFSLSLYVANTTYNIFVAMSNRSYSKRTAQPALSRVPFLLRWGIHTVCTCMPHLSIPEIRTPLIKTPLSRVSCLVPISSVLHQMRTYTARLSAFTPPSPSPARYVPTDWATKVELTLEEVNKLNKLNMELASELAAKNPVYTPFQHGNFTCIMIKEVYGYQMNGFVLVFSYENDWASILLV